MEDFRHAVVFFGQFSYYLPIYAHNLNINKTGCVISNVYV